MLVVIGEHDYATCHSQERLLTRGMARDSRRRMIESTVTLLAMRGLQATAFSDVLAHSGAPRGSIYHHFPEGKEQLVDAALELAGERALRVLDTVAGQPPKAITAHFLHVWREGLKRSRLRAGRAVLAVTLSSSASTSSSSTASRSVTSGRAVSSGTRPRSRSPRSSVRGCTWGTRLTARSNSRTKTRNADSQLRRSTSSSSSGRFATASFASLSVRSRTATTGAPSRSFRSEITRPNHSQ